MDGRVVCILLLQALCLLIRACHASPVLYGLDKWPYRWSGNSENQIGQPSRGYGKDHWFKNQDAVEDEGSPAETEYTAWNPWNRVDYNSQNRIERRNGGAARENKVIDPTLFMMGIGRRK